MSFVEPEIGSGDEVAFFEQTVQRAHLHVSGHAGEVLRQARQPHIPRRTFSLQHLNLELISDCQPKTSYMNRPGPSSPSADE